MSYRLHGEDHYHNGHETMPVHPLPNRLDTKLSSEIVGMRCVADKMRVVSADDVLLDFRDSLLSHFLLSSNAGSGSLKFEY